MVPFLKGFLNNLSAVQSKQVLRILSQMRDRGEIRSIQDFQKKLADLAVSIQKDQIGQRTPPLTFEEGELLESDAIRTFTEFVRLDLEAALGETERLSNSMRAHNRILTENYFNSLEAAISELEAETRAYEILEDQKFNGFTSKVKHWEFSRADSVPGANPDDPIAASLEVDRRGRDDLVYSPPGKGERGLHLGFSSGSSEVADFFNRVEILTDSTTPQTVLSTSTKENTPVKAIDGDRDTAWKHSVLLEEHPPTARLIIAPSFTGARRVNCLVIDPLADATVKIASVSYVDSGGQEVQLPVGSDYSAGSVDLFDRSGPLTGFNLDPNEWILSNTRKVIPVGDIIARRFIITLQQDSGGTGDFFYYDHDLGDWVNTTAEDVLQGMPDSNLDGETIAQQLGFIGDQAERRKGKFLEYVFGLNEVSTLAREYLPNGRFIPEIFETSSAPNILSLYTDIDYPVGEDTDAEFLLLKQNYDSSGVLLDTETIPMLPVGDSSIDERLFLTEIQNTLSDVNDTGALRFYPDFSQSFIVASNGTPLTLGTEYQISVDGGATFESVIPPVGTPADPAHCLVRLTDPQGGIFYTTSYTPLVSTSEAGGEVWLNRDHTVRLGRFQTYVFNNQRATGKVATCKMGLQIILRANTLNTRVSPYLREAILLGG